MLAQITPLYKKHDHGIEFLVAVHDSDEISRVSLCKDLNHVVGANSKMGWNLLPKHI